MKFVFRALAAFLLFFPMVPQSVKAGGDMGQDPYEIGERYYAKQDYAVALKYYQRARKKNDLRAAERIKAVEERLKKAAPRPTDLLEQGKFLFRKGKYREAEKVLLQAAAKDTSKPEAHFYLGEVYMKLEAYGKAEAEYNKAKGYY